LVIASLPKTDRIVAHCPSLRGRAWHCLHGTISAELTRKRGVSRWLKRRQLYQTYHRCKLLTVSAGLLPDLHAACGAQPAQAVTLPNPFDFAAIRAAAQAPCPLDGQPFLLHVGRFHPVKRHDRLFEAVKCSGYQGKLVLLGQGAPADTARLQAAAAHAGVADQVVWAGFVANPYPYLRAAQAVVLSSDFEGFGNVLVEALACGTPVVSTRCPYGPAEILTGDLARGLSDLTASDLACALNAVLAAPPQPTAAQLDRFALDNVVSRYLALADAEGGFTV
jgi:glycosyltransferase involved in cell wall biosynthesis